MQLKDDKERHYITTEGIDIGYSTLQRMTIAMKQNGTTATARILTEWMAGTDATMMAQSFSGLVVQSNWNKAFWKVDRSGIAFGESLRIAQKIERSKISFE
jgi:hypothetical protein